MCGRYSLTSPPEAVRALFGYAARPNFPPRYNIAPTQPIAIVRQGRNGIGETVPEFALARWGFVPSWARQIGGRPLINARSETVAEKPSFRAAFRHRRCLVPADGYYEWCRNGDGPSQPHYIRPRRRGGAGLFAMAAIWECWTGADGGEVDTVAILTRAASPDLAPIHHRMPCVLAPGRWAAWMDSVKTDPKAALAMLAPTAMENFQAVPVSTAVNRVANDGPGLQLPCREPAAPLPDTDTGTDPAPRLL